MFGVADERVAPRQSGGGSCGAFFLEMQSWQTPIPPTPHGLLALDPLGHLFLTLVSVLFLATAIYFVGYHQQARISQRVFLVCMLMLLAAQTLVCTSQHLGIMWVALEASSLAAPPLIYFRLGPRSLEATWKFLLMNSVGIALALLGIFCIAVATTRTEGGLPLVVASLVNGARQLDPAWLRAGFLLALVGFGTKMGLAPMHSWKPDAYGEAPPPVAALMAGEMTLGAFIGILRIYQICFAAGQAPMANFWMSIFGLLSIATAGIFVVGNNDYRRILAYTSVEHMGILVLGVSLATTGGAYASMLHAMHNTLNKGVLLFVAGFIWRVYRTNRISEARGALHHHPAVGILLVAGLCATAGMPSFGMFYSELGILLAAIRHGQYWVAAIYLLALSVVFVGLMTAMLPMAFGDPPEPTAESSEPTPGWLWRQPVMLAPAAALAILALCLGVYQPRAVRTALEQVAAVIAPEAQP